MNRIILIGNGFDLAHGMATTYKDFIDDYWKNEIKKIRESKLYQRYENEDFTINRVSPLLQGSSFEILKDSFRDNPNNLKFNNKFLEIITAHKCLKNWVDIEAEYYRLLLKTIKIPDSSYGINVLNHDFERVKGLFEAYLIKIENDNIQKINDSNLEKKIVSKIYSSFNFNNCTEEYIKKRTKIEFDKAVEWINSSPQRDLSDAEKKLFNYVKDNNHVKYVKKKLLSDYASNYFNVYPEQILFLNFNYTHREAYYKETYEKSIYDIEHDIVKEINHIHGSIKKEEANPIIFGFGDELDEDYKLIENQNENEYLENIKSIKYLNTKHYKRLLEFVNSSEYQICIFGHSCGISDRTLLNTLFEHENCVSIKPYFHQKSENEDNYSDIVRNISRNFNNKAVMREKVVNKQYCEPLC